MKNIAAKTPQLNRKENFLQKRIHPIVKFCMNVQFNRKASMCNVCKTYNLHISKDKGSSSSSRLILTSPFPAMIWILQSCDAFLTHMDTAKNHIIPFRTLEQDFSEHYSRIQTKKLNLNDFHSSKIAADSRNSRQLAAWLSAYCFVVSWRRLAALVTAPPRPRAYSDGTL